MKKYKLLKDLPFAKAGDEFGFYRGDDRSMILTQKEWNKHMYEIDISDIENFDEWFEEIKDPESPKEFFYVLINRIASVSYLAFSFDEETKQEYRNIVEKHKSVDNYFETKEEAEKYLEYLKAKAIIKQDTKGFKPNWEDKNEDKWYGIWDIVNKELSATPTWFGREDTIYFQTEEDIEESFKKHPDEWKTYLTCEQ